MARSSFCALLPGALALALAGCASTGVTTGESTEREARTWGAGAVSRIEADEIAQVPAQTLEDLLVGRVAGLRVEMLPGGRQQVVIRGQNSIYGSNEPLYVVDGVPLLHSAGGLSGINPSDVESIEVLKGGSAALYGVRGANGVIVIRTKRGGR